MSRPDHPIVTPWLATLPGGGSPGTPLLFGDFKRASYGYSKSAPAVLQTQHDSLNPFDSSSGCSSHLNSYYRSTLELLKVLPSPSKLTRTLPDLPTYHFSTRGLISKLPGKNNPLRPSVFKSLATAAAEYSRILDLRECLRVEEIATEMQMDMGQTFVEPPVYRAFNEHLGDVRIFIWIACRSLQYIESECSARGLDLDIELISKRRIAARPRNHPFFMVSRILKPGSWERFNDYSAFMDKRGFNMNANNASDGRNAVADVLEDEDDGDTSPEENEEMISGEDGNDDEDMTSEGGDNEETKTDDAQSETSLPEPADEEYYVLPVDGFAQSGSCKPLDISEPVVVHPSNFLPISFSSDAGHSCNIWEDTSMTRDHLCL